MPPGADEYLARIMGKIARFGVDAVFSQPDGQSSYDPVGGKFPEARKETGVQAVMLAVRVNDIEAGLAQTGDARLLVAGNVFGQAPDSNATVRIGEQEWRVVNCEAVELKGVPLLWKLTIRKS